MDVYTCLCRLLQASFSVSENRSDIDINSPNFWQMWAKKADIDMEDIAHKVRRGSVAQ